MVEYDVKLLEINVLTWLFVLYADTPRGRVINHVLSFDKVYITLFREIPNEEEMYAIFHPHL